MEQLLDYRGRLLEKLESSPLEFEQALTKIPSAYWSQGTPSPHQIVARVWNMEKIVYHVRLQRILHETIPALELFQIEEWETAHYNPQEMMEAMLAEYQAIRQQELSLLRTLTSAQWNCTGRHNIFGVRTLQWWVERMLEHATRQLRELQTP